MTNLELARTYLTHLCSETPTRTLGGSKCTCPERWAALSAASGSALSCFTLCAVHFTHVLMVQGVKPVVFLNTSWVPQPPAHDWPLVLSCRPIHGTWEEFYRGNSASPIHQIACFWTLEHPEESQSWKLKESTLITQVGNRTQAPMSAL